MQEYDKLIKLVNSEVIKEGINLPKIQLHKWLVLGQTEYVCENGTLSDGHEKLTPAQKYTQALKELYYLSLNIANQEALAMEAQADYLDALEAMSSAETESEKLRALAKEKRAKNILTQALTTVEDQMRMVRFYDGRRKQLAPLVERQYPKGIEQAEQDNWKAVFEYRMRKGGGNGYGERVDNVPLDMYTKAELGLQYQRPDAVAPLLTVEKHAIAALPDGDLKRFLETKNQSLKLINKNNDKDVENE